MSARFVLGIGTNLGSRWSLLRAALARVASIGGVVVEAVGRPRRTEALVLPGEPPGPAFLNGVACLRAELPPEALLDRLHAIEAELGRLRGRRWAARTLDLDLLTWDRERIDDERITLPHPGLRERAFARAGVADLGWGAPFDDASAPYAAAPRRAGDAIEADDDADALAWALTVAPPSGPFEPLEAASAERFVAEVSRRGAGAVVLFDLGGSVRGAIAPGAQGAPPRRVLESLQGGRCRLRVVD